MKAGMLVATALLLCGCGTKPRVARPMSEKERGLSIKALEHVREAFNRGDCRLIYANVEDGRPHPISEKWETQCRQLRAKLGEWRSFSPTFFSERMDPFNSIFGSGAFAKGIARVSAVLAFDNGTARLVNVVVEEDSQIWAFPPPAPESRPRGPVDSPPIPSPDLQRYA